MKIVLTFLQRRGEVSLEATEVSRSRATDGVVLLKSVRGRSAVVPLVGTFGWTNAVKGLSALLLRQAALQETPDSEVAAIEGEAGSFAASLDYAIAKRPNWSADMFGVSGSGELVIRRLVEISNHNRKRPGPVRIWVRPRSDLRVYVTVNGELVQDSWKLYDLARAINGENGSRLDPCVNGAAPCSGAQANQGVSEGDAGQGDESVVTDRRMPFSIEWQDRLRAEFMIEAQRALRNTGAFSPEWLKRTLSDLGSNQLF